MENKRKYKQYIYMIQKLTFQQGHIIQNIKRKKKKVHQRTIHYLL